MEDYIIIKKLGEGSFEVVLQAMNRNTGDLVAIKKMKMKYLHVRSWKDCLELREVKSLREMDHPNIVKLKDVFSEQGVLDLVFECMEKNMAEVMEASEELFSEDEVRKWCFQLFKGLVHMHWYGYFHRDLKPGNLLVKQDRVKIADFGMAREISSKPPYTDYVTTRYYRAPEVMLRLPIYGSAVDMWAMGAIMAEFFTFTPLFLSTSVVDQIDKICRVIGSPNSDTWAEGLQLAKRLNFQFPCHEAVPLSSLLPSASEDARSLIKWLCSWDPCKRPTALEALKHPFFSSCYAIPRSIQLAAVKIPCMTLEDHLRAIRKAKIEKVVSSMKALVALVN